MRVAQRRSRDPPPFAILSKEGLEFSVMSRVKPAILAMCLCGPLLACSLSEPAPKDFTLVSQSAAKAKETGNTLEEAEKDCKTETRRKGIASVVNILSRFRKGSADEDYVACMKARGYEVKP